jgi:hypothetical protein
MTILAPVAADMTNQEMGSMLPSIGQRGNGTPGNRDFPKREPGSLQLVPQFEYCPSTFEEVQVCACGTQGAGQPSATERLRDHEFLNISACRAATY